MSPHIHWPDKTLPVRIDCALGVLTRLEMLATDGLLAMPRIGLGVGGLLLGRRLNGGIEILETKEISCSHSLGPAFVLTPEEIAASPNLVASSEMPDNELVGWYCSKPAGSKVHNQIATEHDQAVFDALCPEPWQVMLLIHPSMGKTTTAVFGVRAPAGNATAFLMGKLRDLAWQELAAFQVSETAPTVIPIPMPQTGTLFGVPETPAEKVTKTRRWPLRLLIAAIVLTALSAAAFFTRNYWMPRPPIALIASSDWTGRVSFVWNAEALREQDQATLVIDDGSGPLHTIHLDREGLRKGSYQYLCRPGSVNATLLAGDLSDTVTIKVKRSPQ